MRDKVNQMFKDKLFLVVLVLGLLTLVAAAGIITVQRGRGAETNPYLEMPQQELIAEETKEENRGAVTADRGENTSAAEETQRAAAANPNREDDLAAEAGAGGSAAQALVLDFTADSRMLWPVRGNVLLDYSMDKTIYFPTLDQYKCNPGIVIQSDVNTYVNQQWKMGTAGRALRGIEIKTDPDSDEFCYRGRNVMMGYGRWAIHM